MKSIIDVVMESCIRDFGRDYSLNATGTRYGPSLDDWDNAILTELLESKQGLPRCLRNLNWNSQKRLDEIRGNKCHTFNCNQL